MRLSIAISAVLICAGTGAFGAADPARATQACVLVYRASPDPSAIIWTGGEDERVVLYTTKGERIECSFAGDSPFPRLSSLQSTAADQSVSVLSGKALDKYNQLIADHFKASGRPGSQQSR